MKRKKSSAPLEGSDSLTIDRHEPHLTKRLKKSDTNLHLLQMKGNEEYNSFKEVGTSEALLDDSQFSQNVESDQSQYFCEDQVNSFFNEALEDNEDPFDETRLVVLGTN